MPTTCFTMWMNSATGCGGSLADETERKENDDETHRSPPPFRRACRRSGNSVGAHQRTEGERIDRSETARCRVGIEANYHRVRRQRERAAGSPDQSPALRPRLGRDEDIVY